MILSERGAVATWSRVARQHGLEVKDGSGCYRYAVLTKQNAPGRYRSRF